MRSTPDLDDHCSRYFTYRDIVECGKSWARASSERRRARATFDNRPAEVATYTAIARLARAALDPAHEHFGELVLTYGFASRALTRGIASGIAPRLDQHAGHELSPKGRVICPRLGQAADFCVPGIKSRELVTWLARNTRFDRIYFYGDDRPIHVSVGPEHTRQIVWMRKSASGALVPQVIDASRLER